MALETDYVEYGIQLTLTILGLSASYFIDPAKPLTLLSLLVIPLLYGYTAYVSRDDFSYSSLVALSGLVFLVVGGLTSLIAVFYSIGNVLVSYFASGNRFKDFYGSTSLPMLIMGFMIGCGLFGYGSLNPSFQGELADVVGEKSGQFSGKVVSEADIIENQKQAQLDLVNSSSVLSIRLASQEVMNQTGRTPELRQAFIHAEDSVKQKVYSNFQQQFEEQDVDLSNRMETRITEKLNQMNFALVIPIVTGFFYSLQPLLGILTGLFGKFLMLIGPS